MCVPLSGVSGPTLRPDALSVNPNLMRHRAMRLGRASHRALAPDQGFTLVETLLAGVILLIVATGIAGVLTSSISANTVARERTNAEQCANDVIEQIRRKDYDSVGIVLGNPPGTVPQSSACGTGLPATATVAITYVNDPTATSYATAANYKKVTVTVTRDRDGKQLARMVTFVSPESRAPYGGINNAIINATVYDLGTNLAYTGAATVTLADGPSPTRSDTTDLTGSVSFAALTPNPTTGPQAYYNLTVAAAAGYETLPADLPSGSPTPPATASHIQLAPSQTSNTTIQIYKPATINVVLLDASNNPYTGGAALSITSSYTGATTTDSVAAGASSKTITTLGGKKIIPGATYTVVGRTTTGLCATPTATPVPTSGYPTNTSGTFTLQFTPCPTGTLSVNVQQSSANVSGATVDVTGGPNNMSFSGVTNASGNVSFTVPAGSGYTITATKSAQSASTTASVTQGATTNATVTLPPPPVGNLLVTVNWGSPIGACTNCVTLSGGPNSISVTGSTSSAGQVTFSNVPTGSGYTVTATKNAVSAAVAATITTGTTTSKTVDLPTGTVNVTVKYGGVLAADTASVTISGGPNALPAASSNTNSGGVLSGVLPAGNATTYTITASKAGQTSAAQTFTLPANGSVANVTINLPVGTVNVTARWGTAGPFANGAAVAVSGGPNAGTTTGVTNASGLFSYGSLPAGSGSYAAQVSQGAASATSSSFSIGSSGAVANVTVTLPVRSTVVITVTNKNNGLVGAGKSVTISGGAEGLVYSGTTNSSSQVTFTNVPASSDTYVAKAWDCSSSTSNRKSITDNALVITAGTGTQSVSLKYNSNTCPP